MPGPKIPMNEVLRDCTSIYAELRKAADRRSMVHLPYRIFKRYPHSRTYWGYFRDARWLITCSDAATYSVDRYAVIDEDMINRLRAKRTRHRQTAITNREVKRLLKETA